MSDADGVDHRVGQVAVAADVFDGLDTKTSWILLIDAGVLAGRGTRCARPWCHGSRLYDLAVGSSTVRPNEQNGYDAAAAATADAPAVGNVGVGTGATSGKRYRGTPRRGGFGAAAVELPHGMIVAGFVVTNSLGDVGSSGTDNVPGAMDDLRGLVGSMNAESLAAHEWGPPVPATTLAVVATNVDMSNLELGRAQLAGHGVIRSVHPAYLNSDGDVVFALSSLSGEHLDVPDVARSTVVDTVCIGAAEAVRRATISSVVAPTD